MVEPAIRLIVGLGNPGAEYAQTRHNVGFWFADALAARAGCEFRLESKLRGHLCRAFVAGAHLRLMKPATFMNHSGQAVAAVIRYFDIPPSQMLVAHDELDLPVGTLRLKTGGGHAGHNGLRDIVSALGTRDFWRLRIGIAHPGDRRNVVGYVLSRPSRDDENRIVAAIADAALALPDLLDGRFQKAMNRLHRAPQGDSG
jgi:PTH1 family peptidyl-tRNA hydrolase